LGRPNKGKKENDWNSDAITGANSATAVVNMKKKKKKMFGGKCRPDELFGKIWRLKEGKKRESKETSPKSGKRKTTKLAP